MASGGRSWAEHGEVGSRTRMATITVLNTTVCDDLTIMLNYAINNEAIRVDRPISLLTGNPNIRGIKAMAKTALPKKDLTCQVDNCDNTAKSRGYCKKHYERLRLKGTFSTRTCKLDGCNKFPYAYGLCSMHYQRKKDLGSEYARSKFDPNEMIVVGDVCEIQLYDQKNQPIAKAIIDAEDKHKVDRFKWHITRGKTSFYVGRSTKCNPRLLHNLLIGNFDGTDIDHIDGNPLNNRKSNLRPATRSQNNVNSGINKNNTSGFKGVAKSRDRWLAQTSKKGQHIYIGVFQSKIEAAKAYDKKAEELFGEFAVTNAGLGLI